MKVQQQEDKQFFDDGACAASCWRQSVIHLGDYLIEALRDWQAGFSPEPIVDMEDSWLRGFMSVIESRMRPSLRLVECP